MSKSTIDGKFDEGEFLDALESLKDMEKSIDDKYLKSTMRRKAKPMVSKMKTDSHSARLTQVIGVTTAKSKTPLFKVGVVKNKKSLFPDITSYGLASILEYGTIERYRATKSFGIATGRASTGKIPSGKYGWLRNAWDSSVKRFEADTISTIIKKVEKELK